MKTTLLLTALATLALNSGCSPANAPQAPAKNASLCQAEPCQLTDSKGNVLAAKDFYARFESRTEGSCADQASMGFNTLVASGILTKDLDGFAQARIDLDPSGTYTGFFVGTTVPFGPNNPESQTAQTVTNISGNWHLGNDKIVIEGFGIGRKNVSDDELLFIPMSTANLNVSPTPLMSFTHQLSRINSSGQTVEQVCANQAPVAPAPVPPKPKDQ